MTSATLDRAASHRITTDTPPARRSLSPLLAPLEGLTQISLHLLAEPGGKFEHAGSSYRIPKFTFTGPKGGGELLKIGVFAGVHGDEPEGVHATIQLLRLLASRPEVANGYQLSVYPVCNPTGFEVGTRHTRNGKDLNREFWRESTEPEVRWLESELLANSFHGIIALHTDNTSTGFYGFAQGATLTRHLIEPALAAAAEFLPRNLEETIDGFPARNGIIRKCYEGTLRPPPKSRPRPFDIILETPQAAPSYLKEAALVSAVRSILEEYREFISYAQNL